MLIVMIFNMSTSCFHKNSFHYFQDYLMTKLTLEQVNLIPKVCKFFKFILCVLFYFYGYVGFGSCNLSCVVGSLFQKMTFKGLNQGCTKFLISKGTFNLSFSFS